MDIYIGSVVKYSDLLHPENTNHSNRYFVLEKTRNNEKEVLRYTLYKLVHVITYEYITIKVWDHANGFEYQIHIEDRSFYDYFNFLYVCIFVNTFI